jgi:hypothetical protein
MAYMIRFFLFFISCLVLLSSCSGVIQKPSSNFTGSLSDQKYQSELDPDIRIELAKSRRKELDSIRKGDYFIIKNNPQDALSYYLQVAEKLPRDVIVKKKIAHAYFLQKNWKNAYTYYSQVPLAELKDEEKKELV